MVAPQGLQLGPDWTAGLYGRWVRPDLLNLLVCPQRRWTIGTRLHKRRQTHAPQLLMLLSQHVRRGGAARPALVLLMRLPWRWRPPITNPDLAADLLEAEPLPRTVSDSDLGRQVEGLTKRLLSKTVATHAATFCR